MYDLTFDSVDGVPEELKPFATKDETTGKLKIPVVPKAKLNEFRDNNIRLAQERDGLKQTADQLRALVGEDPAAFKSELDELRSLQRRVKDGELTVSTEIEAELNRRVAAMKTAYEEQLAEERKGKKEANDKAATLDRKLRNGHVERAVTEAALRDGSGVLTSAIKNLVRDALDVFVVDEEGKMTPKRNGVTLYGENGSDPMSVQEWIASLKRENPHYFKDSRGGGGGGGDRTLAGVAGMSRDEFQKLSAKERLELANKHNLK